MDTVAEPLVSAQDEMVLEYRICADFRKQGRTFTDAELAEAKAAAVERLAARRRAAAAAEAHAASHAQAAASQQAKPAEPKAQQLELLDSGSHAAAARRDALEAANLNVKGSLKAAVVDELRAAGRFGRTRYELAQAIGCQQSSLCSTVIELLTSGEAVELAERRKSPVGGAGCIVLLADFAEGR